ncbi:MAG: hypothetical protein HYS13_21525 [Planctomycetia bacterium]|nr:hypothetical protein [Planctomycetia bacterium]
MVTRITDQNLDGIGRQKTCPVMGETLGQHGDVVKVLVDGLPIYLCCESCVDKLKQDPLTVLARLSVGTGEQEKPAAGKITVAQAAAADREAIAAQGNCPVMGKPLGSPAMERKVTYAAAGIAQRYGVAFRSLTQSSQQTNTSRPASRTLTGLPLAPSKSPVTGHVRWASAAR